MPANRKRFSAQSTGRAAGGDQVGCLSQQVAPLPRWGVGWEIKLGFASIFIVNEIKEGILKKWWCGPMSCVFLVSKWIQVYLPSRLSSTSFDPSDVDQSARVVGSIGRWRQKPVMAQEVGEQMARGAGGLWGAGNGFATPGRHKSDVGPQLESTESLLTPPGDAHCWRRRH